MNTFFGLELKTAAYWIGLFSILATTVFGFRTGNQILYRKVEECFQHLPNPFCNDNQAFIKFVIITCVIIILLTIPSFLLVNNGRKHYRLVPWLCLNSLVSILLLIVMLDYLINYIDDINFDRRFAIFIGLIVYYPLHYYMFMAVFSLYYKFKAENIQSNQPNILSVIYFSNA